MAPALAMWFRSLKDVRQPLSYLAMQRPLNTASRPWFCGVTCRAMRCWVRYCAQHTHPARRAPIWHTLTCEQACIACMQCSPPGVNQLTSHRQCDHRQSCAERCMLYCDGVASAGHSPHRLDFQHIASIKLWELPLLLSSAGSLLFQHLQNDRLLSPPGNPARATLHQHRGTLHTCIRCPIRLGRKPRFSRALEGVHGGSSGSLTSRAELLGSLAARAHAVDVVRPLRQLWSPPLLLQAGWIGAVSLIASLSKPPVCRVCSARAVMICRMSRCCPSDQTQSPSSDVAEKVTQGIPCNSGS